MNRDQQIRQMHAELIHRVVQASHDPKQAVALEPALQSSHANGWEQLVQAIRRILQGERNPALLSPLDEEDRSIISAILEGIQNPSSLPPRQHQADPTHAAPGLAQLIQAASQGDAQALQVVAGMAEQMSKAGGDMARLAAKIKPLIDGERDLDKLCQGMSDQGQQLVQNIVQDLTTVSGIRH